MTKRKSLIVALVLFSVLLIASVFGIAFFGRNLSAQAAETPLSVSVDVGGGIKLYDGYYLESNDATSEKKGALTEPDSYVAWYKNGILTLNGYNGGLISTGGDITIKLKGENTITSSNEGIFVTDCDSLVIDADKDATLNIIVSSTVDSVLGISVGYGATSTTGSLTIQGNATINIDCATTNNNSSYGIYAHDTFSILGNANLSVKCNFSHETNNLSYCVVSGKNKPVFYTDGVVTLDISESAYRNYCISANNGIDMQKGTLICKYKPGEKINDFYSCAVTKRITTAPEGCVLREEPYSLGETVIKSGAGRTVTIENGTDYYGKKSNQYVEGETVSVKTSIDGLTFVKWEGEGVTFADAAQKETTFTAVDKDVTVTAVYDVFAKQPVFERIGDNQGSISVQLKSETSGYKPIVLINSIGGENSVPDFSLDNSSENFTYKCSSVWASSVPAGTYRIRVEYNGYYFYGEPFEIDYTDKTPRVSVSDMFIRGKRGSPITPTDIELTLSYATFKAIPAKTNVNAWFKSSLPIGLIAEIGEVSEGATKATITISGTPQNKWSGATFIHIPTDVLATGNEKEIYAYSSEGCRIVDPTIYTATVTSGKAQVDGLTKTSIEEGAIVTIIANSPATGYAFDKWIVVSGEITLDDENASTTTFVMPESNVELKATYKHVHSYKNFAEKPATCVATGMKEYFKCETCGKLFDSDRNETTESALTIAIDPTAHVFGELHPEKPATCAADGTKAHKDCTLCHKHFTSDGTTEITDVTVALDPTAHDFETEWTKTSDGHYHVCKNDGCPVGRDEIKAHTPDRAAATETEPVKCTVCGYVITPASIHVHHLTAVPEVGATCIKEGKKSYYACDGCELKFKDASGTEEITDESWLVIPKAHKYGEWIEEVPATAESTGTKAHKDCEFCHKHFDNNGEEIEDLTLYKTYTVYLRWGTLQAGELTSSGTGRAYASIDVREGTVVTIIAQEQTGSVFVKWKVSGYVDVTFKNENSSTTTFVMPASDVWLECEYKSVRTVTVENGTGGGEIEVGQTVTITAGVAPEGKEFDKWVVVSGEVTLANANSESTTFVMPSGDVEIKATYKDKTPSGGGEEPGGETPGTEEPGTDEPGTDEPGTGKPGEDKPGTDDPSGEITPTENKGLSGGAIAGIAVGSVAVAGIGVFAIFWFLVKKKSFAELIAAIKGLFAKK